jgi:glyoxylase-like metal-dependent hydrolase (beta-lactamase superfamily II)
VTQPSLRAPGIWSIALPTPWHVGSVNVYLIDDEPLTLVDAGPRSPAALAALEEALESLGHRLEDIDRVILTHQHLDHGGQAHTLVSRSGAELCALEGLVEWFATFPASLEAEDDLADRVLRRHGASQQVLDEISAQNREVHSFGEPAIVTHPLREGDVLEFANRRLRVHHRPGHSPSDTVLHDERDGVLLAGDLLLGHARSSAVIAPPLDGSEVHVRPRAFAQYLGALDATRTMDLSILLPGHGAPVADHRALIAQRLERYDQTTERLAALLSREPLTASQLAVALKGEIPSPASFFVLCEMLGHLDRLLDAGIATEVDAGVKRFARAPAPSA